jgi:homoserine O-acetyltransferase
MTRCPWTAGGDRLAADCVSAYRARHNEPNGDERMCIRIAASAAIAAASLFLAPVDCADAADGDQQFASLGNCELESGGVIRECRIGYRTWGKLNDGKSNAILMPTWFNGRSEDLAFMVGPDFLDPDRYFILALDALANGVSSSPSNSRVQAGEVFPAVSVGDMVDAHHRVVTEVFGMRKAYAVVGLSMGAMQAFEWSVRMPDFAAKMVAVIGSPRLAAFDLATWETYGRILALYRMCQCDAAAEALAGLSMVSSVPDRLNSELDRGAVAAEIAKRGRARRARFEALAATWDTERQLRAMVAHDITRRFGGDMTAAAKSVKAKSLIVVSADDRVVTPGPSLEFAKLMRAETFVLDANCGHGDPWCAPEVFAKAVKDFLN